ncbi:GntR family transcriptional regulator [Ammoniphilus sp. YIM 78166]|uniref:GntR family transcriptional regulator n=1 Tax=Ammoniphilus sp. YIM 78166 TaxID=1644106 RepID=UPI001430FB34|nr:GntR family transcriptional regulator [Ammoniphilus sp. YIM 78166]
MDHLEGYTKSDRVYEFLKEKILTASYKPRDRIVIREISRLLGVSDIPVREAIQKLSSEGLLETKSHRGARVAAINLKNLKEIFLIRTELETLAARLAVREAKSEEIVKLDHLVRIMDECYQSNNIPEYTRYNREFHMLLIRACHAPVLIEIIENLYMKSENSKMIFTYDSERLCVSNIEHREIVDGLIEKDEEKVARLIRFQKENGFRNVLHALMLSQSMRGE